jgi:hypothetical protein
MTLPARPDDQPITFDVPVGKHCNVRIYEADATVTVELNSGTTITFRVVVGARFTVLNQGDVKAVSCDVSDDYIESENKVMN